MKIAVIGGGAAGFFAAIHASGPGRTVEIFEKSPKLLSKVKVSGGGRCNVTHRPLEISKLIKNYPRGGKFLKRVFHHFKSEDTIQWFEERGVALKEEADGRVFPKSDQSQSIINALQTEAEKLKIKISVSTGIRSIFTNADGFDLETDRGIIHADAVIVATGGHPKKDGYSFLSKLKHQLVSPIPSLFTFNTPQETIRKLMGLSVPNANVRLEGTKLSYQGPILITHWGISGPAVLKLSAFGADWMFEHDYKASAIINWNANFKEDQYTNHLKEYSIKHPNRKVENYPLFELPSRLWIHFLQRSEIDENLVYGNLSKKHINKLVQNLFCYNLTVEGKTTFKEEFVTAGGLPLHEINPDTMESIYYPNLYFAGEVLDIDGITGGFNFQAAWSTGFLAGKSTFKQKL
ncbi:NAD(P)/FAD-dependent oxidoreductase [Algoriphagus sp. CAU 1675]|uniref:NAD(P)/FAD-dependent oxidoreductase n=1 Tax=Algoriphagus sp. CAU 1675 TaxID=3032597 RepID=UPI0023DBEB5F|nr:NAD(P)/FAD-dependent oxidoreductase [Algoriphagus sp. CAU 1675]MDF2157911.1 NAD(P)/FAD-dependent oxidoreductase [Algoriphagus sp. CAU 1675]